MRNVIAKAIRSSIYGSFSHRARDFQSRTYTNQIHVIYKKADETVVRNRLPSRPGESLDQLSERCKDLKTLLAAWSPVTIKDFGRRGAYKKAKKLYKARRYEELKTLLQTY